MPNKTITSSLEITDWFYKKAEAAKIRLSENKIQHLLFLAQIHFALKYERLLMPSLFVCNSSGFYEATIRSILKFGMPLMASPKLSAETDEFLNLIWSKYAGQKDKELETFVRSLDCWKRFYRPEEETVVNPLHLTDSFSASIHGGNSDDSPKPKVLMSQNGPVKVSAWHPRKLTSSNK